MKIKKHISQDVISMGTTFICNPLNTKKTLKVISAICLVSIFPPLCLFTKISCPHF